MSMDCQQVKERIDQLIDFALPEDERAAVRAHIATCEDCQALQEHELRLKRLVQLKARRPDMPPGLHAAVVQRLQGAKTEGRYESRSTTRRLLLAAAMVTVATLVSYVLLNWDAARLEHHAAAEGCADAFLDRLKAADSAEVENPPPGWEAQLRETVKRETGVELAAIPAIPNSRCVGWESVEIGGHRAVRVDFRPQPTIQVKVFGSSRALVSVFLLPMSSTAFSPDFLEKLRGGHSCGGCVGFSRSGSIFCVQRSDFYVATVSNMDESGQAGFQPR